jgi:hypothetical protein
MANSCAARQLPMETHVLKACGKQRDKMENRTLGVGYYVNGCRHREFINVEQYPAEAARHITKPETPCLSGFFFRRTGSARSICGSGSPRITNAPESRSSKVSKFESSTIFERCRRSALNQAPASKSVFSGSSAPANSRQVFVALLPRPMHRRIVTDPADDCVAIAFG